VKFTGGCRRIFYIRLHFRDLYKEAV